VQAAWQFCTGGLPRKLVRDLPVSFLFLISRFITKKNLADEMATVEMQYCVRERDGEPSWFLQTWSSAIQITQA